MTLHLLMKLSDCAITFKEQTLPIKTNGKIQLSLTCKFICLTLHFTRYLAMRPQETI